MSDWSIDGREHAQIGKWNEDGMLRKKTRETKSGKKESNIMWRKQKI